jgi:hypothetical protein
MTTTVVRAALAALLGGVLATAAGCGQPSVRGGPSGAPTATRLGTGAGVTASPSRDSPSPAGASGSPEPAVRRPDHVVVAVFENKSYDQVAGDPTAPYLNALFRRAAVFTGAHGVTHPSQPNYLAVYSGSTQGVTSDSCPHTFTTANLGQELIASGRTFAGYSESMPSDGYTGCTSGRYARKHNPWVNFANVPASANLRYTRFPTDYATLPTVSFVVPNLCDDMHDCGIATGDAWAKDHLDGYLSWAAQHNSLLVITFDENDGSPQNRILTLFAGAGVRPGVHAEPVDHYRVLRTLLDTYGLPCMGNACAATPITDVWG